MAKASRSEIRGTGNGAKKIPLVEDGEFNRDLITQLLEDEYEVVLVPWWVKKRKHSRPAAMIHSQADR